MKRTAWISCLCVAAAAGPSRGDVPVGAAVSFNEQLSTSTSYFSDAFLAVGSGPGYLSNQVSDTFIPIDLGGASGISGGTISGTILDLRPEPPDRYDTYLDGGWYAQLTVDVRLFWSPSSDAASLFRAFATGADVASFQVDDGMPPVFGTAIGPAFSANVSAATLDLADPSSGSFYLGLAGQGYAQLPFPSANSVVGDLMGYSIALQTSPPGPAHFVPGAQPVPEPSSAALLLAAVAGSGWVARRRLRRAPAGRRPPLH